MTPTHTGTCVCGAAVVREFAEGMFADKINSLPFVCDDCTAAAEAEHDHDERQEQERRHQERVSDAMTALPSRLRAVRLDELDQAGRERIFDATRRWATRELSGLVMVGPFGVGKTTIAAGAVRAYVEYEPTRPRWLSAPLILNHLARAFGDPLRETMIDTLGSADHHPLIIDDIDKVRPTASRRSRCSSRSIKASPKAAHYSSPRIGYRRSSRSSGRSHMATRSRAAWPATARIPQNHRARPTYHNIESCRMTAVDVRALAAELAPVARKAPSSATPLLNADQAAELLSVPASWGGSRRGSRGGSPADREARQVRAIPP